MFSVRVPDELAAVFDAAAVGAGGRSALLRRLISGAVEGAGGAVPHRLGPGRSARLMVRLAPAEAAMVDREAAKMGLPRSAWVAALVAARTRGRPTFSAGDVHAFRAAVIELHRVGASLSQIARALEAAAVDAHAVADHLRSVSAFRLEVGQQMRGLRDAFAGNLAYWDPPG